MLQYMSIISNEYGYERRNRKYGTGWGKALMKHERDESAQRERSGEREQVMGTGSESADHPPWFLYPLGFANSIEDLKNGEIKTG